MPTAEKARQIEQTRNWYSQSSGVLFADHRGITNEELASVRNEIRAKGGELHVIKNTLFRIAVGDEAIREIPEEFHNGTTAFAFVYENESEIAKALLDYARTSKKLPLKGGYFAGKALNYAEVKALSNLPPREILLAQVIGLIAAPLTNLIGTVEAIYAEPIRTIAAVSDKVGDVTLERLFGVDTAEDNTYPVGETLVDGGQVSDYQAGEKRVGDIRIGDSDEAARFPERPTDLPDAGLIEPLEALLMNPSSLFVSLRPPEVRVNGVDLEIGDDTTILRLDRAQVLSYFHHPLYQNTTVSLLCPGFRIKAIESERVEGHSSLLMAELVASKEGHQPPLNDEGHPLVFLALSEFGSGTLLKVLEVPLVGI